MAPVDFGADERMACATVAVHAVGDHLARDPAKPGRLIPPSARNDLASYIVRPDRFAAGNRRSAGSFVFLSDHKQWLCGGLFC